MYGGMSGYGGYGGMSSYGSSYGGGLSSYGSGYGSGYGSSYGGLASNRYGAAATTKVDGKAEGEKQGDPNNPALSEDKQKQQQELSHRKMIFEQWFKMMGGLRSIVELGFATIALANFCSKSAEIFKKFLEFSKQASHSLGGFIQSKLPTKIFTNLSSPQRRGKAIKSIVMMVIRIFAALLLCLGVKLRRDIKRDAQSRRQTMEKQLQQMQRRQVQLVEQQCQSQRQERGECNLKQANL